MYVYIYIIYMDVSKNRGVSPQIMNFNRVFHEINHPFWDTPIFGNTHILGGEEKKHLAGWSRVSLKRICFFPGPLFRDLPRIKA